MAPTPIPNLPLLALLLTSIISLTTAADSYTNHTVGGSFGWFFNPTTNTSATDYSKWASNQTFNLGDYLIFNTNSNQSVIQTYNETTYRNCTVDEAQDDDTFIYSGGDEVNNSLTFSVPLTIEGPNYFFSDGEDGVQCTNGMAFEIEVKHGAGLPPSLNQPPPPPYVEPPTSSESDPSGTSNQQEPAGNGGWRYSGGANVRLGVLVLGCVWFLFLL